MRQFGLRWKRPRLCHSFRLWALRHLQHQAPTKICTVAFHHMLDKSNTVKHVWTSWSRSEINWIFSVNSITVKLPTFYTLICVEFTSPAWFPSPPTCHEWSLIPTLAWPQLVRHRFVPISIIILSPIFHQTIVIQALYTDWWHRYPLACFNV